MPAAFKATRFNFVEGCAVLSFYAYGVSVETRHGMSLQWLTPFEGF